MIHAQSQSRAPKMSGSYLFYFLYFILLLGSLSGGTHLIHNFDLAQVGGISASKK